MKVMRKSKKQIEELNTQTELITPEAEAEETPTAETALEVDEAEPAAEPEPTAEPTAPEPTAEPAAEPEAEPASETEPTAAEPTAAEPTAEAEAEAEAQPTAPTEAEAEAEPEPRKETRGRKSKAFKAAQDEAARGKLFESPKEIPEGNAKVTQSSPKASETIALPASLALELVDTTIPPALIWVMSKYVSPEIGRIKSRDVQLTREQKSLIIPLAEVVAKEHLQMSPIMALLAALTGAYAANITAAAANLATNQN